VLKKSIVFIAGLAFAVQAMANDGARQPFQPDPTPPGNGGFPAGVTLTIQEGFDDVTGLTGWVTQNNSDSVGTADWFQGNDGVFAAHQGAATAYVAANFNSTAGTVISNWLITPEIDFGNGAELRFWTRKATGSTFPDRAEIRLSTAGSSTNVGSAPADVGDFTTVLETINPTLAVGGYPDSWTEFVLGNADGIPTSGSGRIAIRYWVDNDAGPTGSNSDYIGFDTLSYAPGTQGPPPGAAESVPVNSTWALMLLTFLFAGIGLYLVRR
jgi:hypothetical protein